uniref:Uncharacterized protein n=1 Tax=Chromera velia CCMP2878 TaxID=1169474 RepID=A0A0G4HMA8_9ALVE|eukprot:Cvel_29075.t1-p1 / transcript=Cvel_29075.t1 / gene=Cvel_29075 / organism=Chromera_velia_CCMP2878 / gene_product=hypothetical protein / transcript_product=hypothetical protein / location=Cvel_scaffold3923:7707-11203(-) / protein_length=489 / sequence_SO=supercontig / SO=protein_coding / is_pseudo=false
MPGTSQDQAYLLRGFFDRLPKFSPPTSPEENCNAGEAVECVLPPSVTKVVDAFQLLVNRVKYQNLRRAFPQRGIPRVVQEKYGHILSTVFEVASLEVSRLFRRASLLGHEPDDVLLSVHAVLGEFGTLLVHLLQMTLSTREGVGVSVGEGRGKDGGDGGTEGEEEWEGDDGEEEEGERPEAEDEAFRVEGAEGVGETEEMVNGQKTIEEVEGKRRDAGGEISEKEKEPSSPSAGAPPEFTPSYDTGVFYDLVQQKEDPPAESVHVLVARQNAEEVRERIAKVKKAEAARIRAKKKDATTICKNTKEDGKEPNKTDQGDMEATVPLALYKSQAERLEHSQGQLERVCKKARRDFKRYLKEILFLRGGLAELAGPSDERLRLRWLKEDPSGESLGEAALQEELRDIVKEKKAELDAEKKRLEELKDELGEVKEYVSLEDSRASGERALGERERQLLGERDALAAEAEALRLQVAALEARMAVLQDERDEAR